MLVVPLTYQLLKSLDVQPAQQYLMDFMTDEAAVKIAGTHAFAVVHENVTLCAFGVLPIFEHRALAWSFLAKTCGPYLLPMTRIGWHFFDTLPYKRVDIEVDYEFEQGHRWAKMLKFSLEVPRLKHYRVDGGDVSLYTRFKPWAE